MSLFRRSSSIALAAAALLSGCSEDLCPNPGDICTVAGTGVHGFGGDGDSAVNADLYFPMDVAVGPDQLTYIVDWNNHRLRAITRDGKMETIAGTGELGDSIGSPVVVDGRVFTSAIMNPPKAADDPFDTSEPKEPEPPPPAGKGEG